MDDLGMLLSINISGRFNGREMKCYGQEVLKHILLDKSVAICFGQQTSFKPDLPYGYEYMGGTKAFMLYNTSTILAGDEKNYKFYLRDLELQDRLPRYYLPETNYSICKMKTKNNPLEFIAMSWLTDECMGKHKSISQFKKVCAFIDNLEQVEELPIVLSGTFRVDYQTAKEIVPPDFRVCSYFPSNKRRNMRHSNFFICSRSLTFADLKPVVCGKMDIANGNGKRNGSKLINPEDVFYWDPCIALLKKKPDLIQQTINILDLYVKKQEEAENKTNSTSKEPLEVLAASNEGTMLALCEQVTGDNESEQMKVEKERKSNLRKVASFEELYDEEVVHNTGVCYMQ